MSQYHKLYTPEDSAVVFIDHQPQMTFGGSYTTSALANELAVKFYFRRGWQTVAYAYLRNARDCYLRWGAVGKGQQIDQKYPGLTEERVVSSPGTGLDSAEARKNLVEGIVVGGRSQYATVDICLGRTEPKKAVC